MPAARAGIGFTSTTPDNLPETASPFLFKDLRIEPAGLADSNFDVVRQYVTLGGRQRQMQALLRVLEEVA